MASMKILMMTIAEQLEQRGIAKGIQQGRQEGRLEAKHDLILAMRVKGVEPALVRELSGLTDEELKNLN